MAQNKTFRPLLVPALIAAALLLGALIAAWPYEYYRVLRWVVCVAAVCVAWAGYKEGHTWAAWLFGVIALLFNPIKPFHLDRSTWLPIDAVTGVLFIIAGLKIKRIEPHGPKEFIAGEHPPE